VNRYLIALLLLVSGCNEQFRFGDKPDATIVDPHCQVDGDCADGSLHCDVVSHQCVACRGDSDCSGRSAPRCDLALHRCVECGANQDCAAGSICEPTTRRCLSACAEGSAEHVCPASAPTCDEVAGFCVQCQSDAECKQNTDDGTHCDLANGRCVYCFDDSQCQATEPRCDRTRGRCGQCTSAADCPIGSSCNAATLRCITL
jgi:Cys-rich repeat protein